MTALIVYSITPTPIQFSFSQNKYLDTGTIIGQFQVLANRSLTLSDLTTINVDWGDGTSNSPLSTNFFQIQTSTPLPQDPTTVVISIPNNFNKKYDNPINYNVKFTINIANQIITASSQAIIRCPLINDTLQPTLASNNIVAANTKIINFLVNTLIPAGLNENNIDENYSALIDWGDDSSLSLGLIRISSSTTNPVALIYSVENVYAHTYSATGNYIIQVQITNQDGEISSLQNTIDVTQIISNLKVNVIIPEPVTFKGVEGNALIGPNLLFVGTVIGQFTIESEDGSVNDTNFFNLGGTINVDWGDTINTNLIASNITSNGIGNKTVFIILANDVNSQHIYSESGKYNVSITVKIKNFNLNINLNTVIASFAEIVDAEITVVQNAISVPFQPNNVLPADTVLTNFTDANPNSTTNDFYAMIDWGDGSPINLGEIKKDNNHLYSVSYPYQHIYPPSLGLSNYTIRIVIYHVDGEKATTSNKISLYGSTPNCCNPSGNNNNLSGYDVRIYSIVGCAKQNIFITSVFTDLSGQNLPVDPNYLNNITINWGDGKQTLHDIIPMQINNTSQYLIRSQHKYCECGVYNVTITVKGVPAIAQVTIRECNKCNHNC
jgi:hypothetical protein